MATDRTARALEKSSLFQGLAGADRGRILEISVTKHFPRNSLLFSDGDPARAFFMVVAGRVKVFKLSPDGKEQILHVFGPGEVIGEVPVFSGNAFPASAMTLEESEILLIPREGFRRLAMDRPQILWNLLVTLSRRLRKFTVQIERLSLKEVASRLAGALLEMMDGHQEGGPEKIDLLITKTQLASQIGTTPETLSRTLRKMTSEGIIKVQRKRICILDREAMETLASGGSSGDA